MVAGLRARDRESIGIFFRTYYDKVYPICAAILGKGVDARDMTVDILVDFVENRVERLSSSNAMYAFLRQTAVRRSVRYRERLKKTSDLETESYPSEESTPEDKANINILMPLLKQCLGNLSPKAQMTLRLKYTKKISNEQIGEIVGGSKSYIGRLLKQGKKSLRRCIESKLRQQNAENRQGASWTDLPSSAVRAFVDIEQLFSMRAIHAHDGCDEPIRMAEALADIRDTRNMVWADAHLLLCANCRESLLYMNSTRIKGIRGDDRTAPNESNQIQLLKKLAVAALILMTLSIGYIKLVPHADTEDPGSSLVVKGHSDGFYAAVKRGPSSFILNPMDKLLEDDQIGLFYTMDRVGYLSVYNLDSSGKAVLLYPAGGRTSALMAVGQHTPINDGAIVGKGEGCEWLIAVFSNEPLWVDDISKVLISTTRSTTEDGCRLVPEIPGARTVHVLPVIR